MQVKRLLVTTGAACACVIGVAYAAHAPQVDPATVPTGLLVTHSNVPVVPAAAVEQAVKRGAEVSVQHARLTAGQTTPWHTHPGPVIVMVVGGALTYEHVVGGTCRRDLYEAGSGFTDRGLGKVHRAVAGPDGADFYATYILPRGSEHNALPRDPLPACAG